MGKPVPVRFPDLKRRTGTRRSGGCLIGGMLFAIILIGLLVSPAMAEPALVLSPSSGRDGVQVTATGSSFNLYGIEFPQATIRFNGNVVASNVWLTRSGTLGSFTTSFTVPVGTPRGSYTVQATGPLDTATATFTVVYPAVADFTMSPSSGMGQAPLTVYFTDRSTGNPSAWSWNFGDGQASSFQNPSHMYVTPGTYTVILSASNAAGSSSTSKTVIVQNKPALTLSPSSGPAGTRVTASGSSFNLYGIEIPSATVSFNGIVLSGNVPITRSGNLGSFTTSITIPANTAQGTYTIRAAGPLDSAEATYTVTNIPPESQINVNPLSGKSPLLVRFDGTRSLDRDGSINSYRWDFGDGTSAVGGTAEHTYTRPGRKYATLTVTDNQGAADTDAVTITVENSPPVAIASAVPESGSDPLMVTLDGSRSNDPDGTIRSFHWDFGDGSRAETSSAGHEYRNLGTYQAILTVTDDNGETGQATVQITVGNEVPVARITVSPQEGTAPLPVRFDGSESYDRDDTDLTFSWDYGDGNHGNGRTATHTYQKEGTYQVSFQVTDPHGATGRASATVRVSPPFPWWLVVIGGLGAVVGAKVVIPRVWPPTVVVPPAELPSDCEFPEPSVHVEVHSGVECELGTDGRLPDISVDIRSGIWKEDDER